VAISEADRAEFRATIPTHLWWRIEIDPETGCFRAVRGARSGNRHAYPAASIAGRSVILHRWVWKRAHGSIPEDRQVIRTCWVNDCVRVSHMALAEWSELHHAWRAHHGEEGA
jgi:hypothetical protein